MLHVIAVLVTLFPGFGLGYLLLRRFREFVNTFLISAFVGCFVAAFEILGPSHLPAREVLGVVPILALNVYHAHRIWMRDSKENQDEEDEPGRIPFRFPPLVVIGVFALAILLGVLSIPSLFPEGQLTSSYQERRDASLDLVLSDLEERKLRRKEVEAKLGKHKLSYRIGFTTERADYISYLYHVDPGGYTMMIHTVNSQNSRRVRDIADEIASYTEDFVYASGFEVYELNTGNRDAVLRVIADLNEGLPGNCKDSANLGVCGYEPR